MSIKNQSDWFRKGTRSPLFNQWDMLGSRILALFALVVPFEGLDVKDVSLLALRPCEVVVIVGAPFALYQMWRARDALIRSKTIAALAVLAAVTTVSSLFSITGTLVIREVAKAWAPVWVVAVSTRGQLRTLLIGAAIGGCLAIAISLTGYLAVVGFFGGTEVAQPFVFRSTHPLFDNWPRLTGPFSASPQRMGEYLLVYIAVLAYLKNKTPAQNSPRWKIQIGLALAVAGVSLTFSSCWIGLPLALAGVSRSPSIDYSRWLTRVAVVLTLIIIGISSWVMNVGLPVHMAPAARYVDRPCVDLDSEHNVTAVLDRRSEQCRQFVENRPYLTLLTNYRFAKEIAIEAFRRSPWIGIGLEGYRRYAARRFAERYGQGSIAGSYYDFPHSLFFGTAASTGVLGLAALFWFIFAVWKSRPADDHPGWTAWLVLVAMFGIGLNIDILWPRAIWFLIGIVSSIGFDDRFSEDNKGFLQ
jgi:hypothetical protein